MCAGQQRNPAFFSGRDALPPEKAGFLPICIRLRMRDGCRTGFATPSETFAGGDPENIPDGVANPVRQNQS
ncbi:Uncharacterized protein dnm_096060 [Desulfonema magnum]|uniref:Uncharacterized protein n=1 Tax=Desulfonema magnum TaxID=45655 RepID=A0A975BYU0_9BACT|nr:Uncharacterized protein dnm_096060 [Desulfonema magnum]